MIVGPYELLTTISLLSSRDNKFFWHLKLIFPQSHTEYVARRVPDDRTLDEILNLYIHPTESDPTIRQKLNVYVQSSCTQKIFMKVENRKSNSLRYYELDSKKSLLENLKNKTVIEYPVLHIVLEDHFHQYVGLGQAETKEGNEESSAGIPVKESEEQEEGEIQDDTDGVKAIGQQYYELDSKKSLLENLKNKTVIEYPVLHIVLEDHFHQYVGLGQAETKEGNEESSAGIPVKESEEQEEGEIQDDTDGVKAIGQQYVIQTLNPE
ncbi:UNVERIFIED_CONTAM: hypothetical protein FKN15_062524 [Acipenser sinensis]